MKNIQPQLTNNNKLHFQVQNTQIDGLKSAARSHDSIVNRVVTLDGRTKESPSRWKKAKRKEGKFIEFIVSRRRTD